MLIRVRRAREHLGAITLTAESDAVSILVALGLRSNELLLATRVEGRIDVDQRVLPTRLLAQPGEVLGVDDARS